MTFLPLTRMWPWQHQLTGHGTAGAEAQTIDHVIQTTLEQLHQVVAGDALHALSGLEIAMELRSPERRRRAWPSASRAAASPYSLILLLAGLAMLSGRGRALSDGALFGVALVALEEELAAFAAAQAANGTCISSHFVLPPVTLFCAWADGIRCGGWASRP